MQLIYFLVLSVLFPVILFGQSSIDVTERTIKVGGGGEEELFYGFAAGDRIIFSFEEIDGKELKGVEILEYPTNSKFSDYKVSRIDEKRISVNNQSVYVFRFKNSALSKRVCKVKIARIPSSPETIDFNTAVKEITKTDTTWKSYEEDVVVGYQQVDVPYTRKVLDRTDTIVTNLFANRQERVHSVMDLKSRGSVSYIDVSLPQKTFVFNEESEIHSWSYFIGVSQEGMRAFQDATNKTLKLSSALLRGNPLAAYSLNLLADFTPSVFKGDNVKYNVSYYQNGNFYSLDQGDITATLGKNVSQKQGTIRFTLENDNVSIPIDVRFDFTVVQIKRTYRNVTETRKESRPIKETQTFKKPIVKSTKVWVNEN